MVTHPRDCDSALQWLLLHHRESVNTTLGYSPAEMVFGRNIRGPIYVVRDVWKSPGGPEIEGKKDVLQYMNELKTRLAQVLDDSRVTANKMQDAYKRYYDRQSTDRKLKIGDKVLVMMPNCSSKTFAQWMGEYPVIRCLNNDHYEIQMERRKAVWHINSLKRFIERDARVGGRLIAQEDDEDAQFSTCLVGRGSQTI